MSDTRLHSTERFELILEALQSKRLVTVPEMATLCHASEMTIRRDFDRLEERGLLLRTHGGAVPQETMDGLAVDIVEPNVDERAQENCSAKLAIATHASKMVKQSQTIALDIGSTCFSMAELLENSAFSIFTTSLKIAGRLSESRPRIYVPGGEIHGSEPSIVGARAVEDLNRFYFDFAFIGVSGVSSEGFYDYSLEDTEIKKAMIARSRTSVVLLDSSKFDRMSVALVSELEDIDLLITDQEPPQPLKDALQNAGVQIDIAPAA